MLAFARLRDMARDVARAIACGFLIVERLLVGIAAVGTDRDKRHLEIGRASCRERV